MRMRCRRLGAIAVSIVCAQIVTAQRQQPSPPTAAVVLTEAINPNASYHSSHASTIAQTLDGTLVAALFGGTGEAHPDVGIWLARRVDGHWENANEVANGVQPDGTRYAAWNPVLFQSPKGPLFLFYKVGPSTNWTGMVITSADEGHTWSKPRRLPQGIIGPVKDKPVVLPDETWISGSSTEGTPVDWRVHFEISADSGNTWSSTAAMDRGAGVDSIQPTILLPGHGLIEALCRTKQGVIAMTWSSDGGHTWAPLAATELPNPNSGIDASTLADGRLLVVYNHSAHLPNWSGPTWCEWKRSRAGRDSQPDNWRDSERRKACRDFASRSETALRA